MNQQLLQKLGQAGQKHEADIVRGEMAVLRSDYEKTLVLLAALKAGEAVLDEVKLTPNGGWQLVPLRDPEPEKPAEVQTPAPATTEG
jgi:hypothetical protein